MAECPHVFAADDLLRLLEIVRDLGTRLAMSGYGGVLWTMAIEIVGFTHEKGDFP